MQAVRQPSGPQVDSPQAAAAGALRWLLAALAGVYALFVVYGSLVPLQPVSMPLAEAWSRFVQTPWPDAAGLSRTDLAVNIGLTVPLAFVLRAALGGSGLSGVWAVVADLACWTLCALLSVAVEWAQVFFPDRSHAWSDVLAQWVGAALGLALHRWRGQAFQRWALVWWRAQSGAPAAVWLLRAWLPALALSSLVPLDLSISPVELYRKWRDGRVMLLPLSDLPPGLAAALWELGSDALLWAPVGAVWRLQGHPLGRIVRWGLLASGAIEAAQLLVLSRVSSTTDLVSACAGCVLGALAAQALSDRAAAPTGLPLADRTVTSARPWLWAWAAWALLLPVLYWYPYAFDTTAAMLADRLRDAVTRVPFAALYVSTEQRAVAEIFRKILLCLPLGVLWAVWRSRLVPRASLAPVAALALTAGLALVIEAGQLALPDKVGDLTDVGLGVLGCALGLLAGARLAGRGGAGQPADRRVPDSPAAAGPAPTTGPGAAPRLSAARPTSAADRGPWLAAAMAWLGVLLLLHWWPLDVQADPALLRERLRALSQAPWGGGALAASWGAFNAGLLQVLGHAPVGLLLALWCGRPAQGGGRWRVLFSWGVLLGTPLLAQLGQLLLASGHADALQATLGVVGGLLGLALGTSLLRQVGARP